VFEYSPPVISLIFGLFPLVRDAYLHSPCTSFCPMLSFRLPTWESVCNQFSGQFFLPAPFPPLCTPPRMNPRPCSVLPRRPILLLSSLRLFQHRLVPRPTPKRGGPFTSTPAAHNVFCFPTTQKADQSFVPIQTPTSVLVHRYHPNPPPSWAQPAGFRFAATSHPPFRPQTPCKYTNQFVVVKRLFFQISFFFFFSLWRFFQVVFFFFPWLLD